MNPNSMIKAELSQLFNFTSSNILQGGTTQKNNDITNDLQEDVYIKHQNKTKIGYKGYDSKLQSPL